MHTLKELREKRAKAIADARELLKKADKEKRELTAEEQSQYDVAWADVEKLRVRIEREENLAEAERSLTSVTEPQAHPSLEKKSNDDEEKQYRQNIFEKYMRQGLRGLTRDELRALSINNGPGGAFLQASEKFVGTLIKGVDQVAKIHSVATVMKVNRGQTIAAPYLKTDIGDADWSSQVATPTPDTALQFGKRSLSPSLIAKEVDIPMALLDVQGFDVAGFVAQRMGYKFGITKEKAFNTGTGSNQPLGLFVASNHGISASRDVATDNSTTAPTFDGLKEAKYTLDEQYWAQAKWLGHSDFYKKVSKIKDSDGQYIWEQSTKVGDPDLLLGIATLMSKYAPNTFTTGKYVAALGDFNFYWVAESVNFEIQILEELLARSNEVGYIGREEVDGMPVLEEAFVRVKLG